MRARSDAPGAPPMVFPASTPRNREIADSVHAQVTGRADFRAPGVHGKVEEKSFT